MFVMLCLVLCYANNVMFVMLCYVCKVLFKVLKDT